MKQRTTNRMTNRDGLYWIVGLFGGLAVGLYIAVGIILYYSL